MKISVFKIENSESVIIPRTTRLNSYNKVFINGEEVREIPRDLVLNTTDTFQYISSLPTVKHYKRGEEVMSCENYKSKKTYYDGYSTEEEILRALANKKELEGFEPVHEDKTPKDIELEIIGVLRKTGSPFILSSAQSSAWTKGKVVYRVLSGQIAMDEYNKLRNKYKGKANFEKPDRDYLRFVKINKNYVFGDSWPFCESAGYSDHEDLTEAIALELTVRNKVRRIVMRAVSPPGS